MLIKPFYIVTTEKLGGLKVKGILEILWPYPSLQPSSLYPKGFPGLGRSPEEGNGTPLQYS